MVAAIVQELHSRQHELADKQLSSIYFGGGTPSLLSGSELASLFTAFAEYFSWDQDTEITLEANPDDINPAKLQELKAAGINRLSIGIQSFDEADLRFMNRAHSAQEADRCIDLATQYGFDRLTADLIYGSPTTSDDIWQQNVEQLAAYDLDHISAYCLTVEEGTALHHQVKKGTSRPVDNDKAIGQFDYLMSSLQGHGYEHYEISNFAKPGKYAVHNTNYWQGAPYLGIGPAAHSYDGQQTRRWNVSHNAQYMKALAAGTQSYYETETLTTGDSYNESVLTRLRTMWGISVASLESKYPLQWQEAKEVARRLCAEGLLQLKEGTLTLTKEGKYLADNVSMQLFF